jgi:hypothetical protein
LVVGAGIRKRHSIVTDRFVGLVLGTTLFVLFPAFIVAGVIDCASPKPGLRCSLVQLAFEDGPAGRIVPMRQAKSQ